jgi:nitrogen regulatory protein PII
MKLHPMKLITIICESLIEEQVVQLLPELGVHGYTAFETRGSGTQGERRAEMREYGNVQIEVIVKPEVSEPLIQALHDRFFRDFAMVVHESDVRVLRPQKF